MKKSYVLLFLLISFSGLFAQTKNQLRSQSVSTLPPDTIIGGYLPYYEITKVTPDIFNYLNQVYYFSLGPDATGELGRVDATGLFTHINNIPTVQSDIDTLLNWRGSSPVKIFVVVGGWVQSDYMDEALSNSVSRTNLVTNIKNFCLTNGIDGVVIDWEAYNAPIVDSDYGYFINELKAAFNSTGLLISTAINPTHTSLANEFANADFIQLMSYGATFGQNTQVPLSTLKNWVNGWVNAGFDKTKIVIGLPAYGRTPADNTSLTYREILRTFNPSPVRDTVTFNNKLYYYNGINTIQQKTQYALDSNLRGVMFWELGQDTIATDPMSLLNAAHSIVQATTTEVRQLQEDYKSLSFFPNPFNDSFTMEFDLQEPAIATISIFEMSGELVCSQKKYFNKGIQNYQINTQNLSSGFYLLNIRSNKSNFNYRLIRE